MFYITSQKMIAPIAIFLLALISANASLTTTDDMDLSAVQGSVLFQGGDYTGVAGKVNVDAQKTYLQGTIDSEYSFEHSNNNNGFVITDKTRVTVNETAEAPLFNQGALSINGDVHVGGRDGEAQLLPVPRNGP